MDDQNNTPLPADPETPASGTGSEPGTPAAGSNEPTPPPAETPATPAHDEPLPELPPPPPPMVIPPVQTPPPTSPYGATPSAETNALAIVSLIASILSWVGLFAIGGIVGVICGVIARNQ